MFRECQALNLQLSISLLKRCNMINRPPGGGVCGSSRIPSALAPSGRRRGRDSLARLTSSPIPTDVGQQRWRQERAITGKVRGDLLVRLAKGQKGWVRTGLGGGSRGKSLASRAAELRGRAGLVGVLGPGSCRNRKVREGGWPDRQRDLGQVLGREGWAAADGKRVWFSGGELGWGGSGTWTEGFGVWTLRGSECWVQKTGAVSVLELRLDSWVGKEKGTRRSGPSREVCVSGMSPSCRVPLAASGWDFEDWVASRVWRQRKYLYSLLRRCFC